MSFNSIEFLLFMALFLVLWPWMNKRDQSRWVFLTLCSLFFYGWWDWRFLFLILFSGLLDFICGIKMEESPKKKAWLVLSLIGNLLLLGIFKIGGPIAGYILPLGISFFTFQSMSYSIDIYRGKLKASKNIFHFFSYLVLFPQLVAGPIVRAKDLLGQLAEKRSSSPIQKWHAIKLIVFGLFQKTVLADNIAVMVNAAFQDKSAYGGSLFWWAVILGFALQIYFDFCGYSLMARGIAKYLGFHFKMNFNFPYQSKSLKEFWSRWHISLSTWFRDYVYIPLGGKQKGFARAFLFMFLTMLLSALWHGGAITFVLWGLVHAFYLGFERWTRWPKRIQTLPLGGQISTLLVLFQVLLAWVFFRSQSLEQVGMIFSQLFRGDFNTDFIYSFMDPLFFIVLGLFTQWIFYLRNKYRSLHLSYRRYHLDMALVPLSLVACLLFRGPESQFIYFQF